MAERVYAIALVALVLAVGAPGFALLGARPDVRVFGVPLTVAWSAGCVGFSFVALLLYDRVRR